MISLPSRSNENWTLFLDRDGVINVRLIDDYVKTVDEFKFTDGFKEALGEITPLFSKIVVVTNQQGVGKGLMKIETLDSIHQMMRDEIEQAGGRIDKVYHCSDLKGSGSLRRKPEVGMGLEAKRDFPDIHFKRSIMTGDSLSDMEFGKKLGMTTVFIGASPKVVAENDSLIDLSFENFSEFASYLSDKAELPPSNL